MEKKQIFGAIQLSEMDKHRVDLSKKKTYSSDSWNTGDMYLIQKDGAWTIAAKIQDNVNFKLGQVLRDHNEPFSLCEIKLDKNDIPYVDLDGKDFTEENCPALKDVKGDISSTKGYTLLDFDQSTIDENSVFTFVGGCSKEREKDYFSANFYQKCLNEKGLAILKKLIDMKEVQKKIDDRIKSNEPIKVDLAKFDHLVATNESESY